MDNDNETKCLFLVVREAKGGRQMEDLHLTPAMKGAYHEQAKTPTGSLGLLARIKH